MARFLRPHLCKSRHSCYICNVGPPRHGAPCRNIHISLMKRRILFVDYTFQKGHVNFNRIHIDALRAAGHEVKIIIHKDLAGELGYSAEDYLFTLPHCLNQRPNSAIGNRIRYILALLYIRLRANIGKWDDVIVSCCDEVTLGLVPLGRRMHVVCHNTATVCSRVKRFFLKRIARRGDFIVFDEYMRKPMLSHGINNVNVISHGCIEPWAEQAKTPLPVDIERYSSVIFHPSAKFEPEFLRSITENKQFGEFLKRENILLVIHNRNSEAFPSSHNIKFITSFLSWDEYRWLFQTSNIILLAYPKEFQYQVSGVSFECVANRKNIIVFRHPALEYCRNFYNYNPIVASVDELESRIAELRSNPGAHCTATREQLSPDYTKILER